MLKCHVLLVTLPKMPSSCLQNCPRNSSYALRSLDSFGGTRTAFFPESLGELWHYIPCYARSSYSQKALVSHPRERATLNGCPHRPPLLICVRARAGPRFTLHRNDLRDKSKKRAPSDAANGRGHSAIGYYMPCKQYVIS